VLAQRAWWLLAVVAAGSFAVPVRAAELQLSAREGCADERSIREQVDRLLGRPLADVEGMAFELSLAEVDGGGVQLRLQTVYAGKAPRQRELSAASCREATDAAAVAIAMAVAERERAVAPPVEAGGSEQPAGAAEGAGGAAQTDDAEAGDEPLRLGVGLGLALQLGALPTLAAGAQLGVGLGHGLWRLELLGALFASQETTLPGDDRGGELGLWLTAVLGCVEPDFGRVRLFGCAGFELGRLTARGLGVMNQRDGDSLWRALRVETGAAVVLFGDLRAMARLGIALPLARDEFVLEMDDHVHRPASLGAHALVGLEQELSW
jgi:hypothetical protein